MKKARKWIRNQFKKKTRIYIWPTKMGGYLNGLIFLLFLMSVGYSNNLLLIFTLFLFSLNLMWLLETHFYLNALKLESVFIDQAFCNENALVSIVWRKKTKAHMMVNIKLENDETAFEVRSLRHEELNSKGLVQFPSRGPFSLNHLLIKTQMPFGLYNVWTYLPISLEIIVYPARPVSFPLPAQVPLRQDGEITSDFKGPYDATHLVPYAQDNSRRICWKVYARSGNLVVKEGEELISGEVNFKLDHRLSDKERSLSILTGQILYCHESNIPYGLKLPDIYIKTNLGNRHLHECLKVLALC